MSVLIKGMEMPANCQNCFASDDESRFCRAAKKYIPMLGKPKFCPIIDLPDHGDLIDRDEVFMQLRKDFAVIERMASEARAMAKDYLDGEKCGMGKAMIRVYEHEATIPAERSE